MPRSSAVSRSASRTGAGSPRASIPSTPTRWRRVTATPGTGALGAAPAVCSTGAAGGAGGLAGAALHPIATTSARRTVMR
jgi:hypothetical protein